MSSRQKNPFIRCDGVSRRSVLQLGQLAGLGIGLSQLNALGSPVRPARAKNCILLWLDGGPSHLETFDLKPQAPTEVRGPLDAISTAVAGVSIGECLPQLAKRFNDVGAKIIFGYEEPSLVP